jgi:hypothetical protein
MHSSSGGLIIDCLEMPLGCWEGRAGARRSGAAAQKHVRPSELGILEAVTVQIPSQPPPPFPCKSPRPARPGWVLTGRPGPFRPIAGPCRAPRNRPLLEGCEGAHNPLENPLENPALHCAAAGVHERVPEEHFQRAAQPADASQAGHPARAGGFAQPDGGPGGGSGGARRGGGRECTTGPGRDGVWKEGRGGGERWWGQILS